MRQAGWVAAVCVGGRRNENRAEIKLFQAKWKLANKKPLSHPLRVDTSTGGRQDTYLIQPNGHLLLYQGTHTRDIPQYQIQLSTNFVSFTRMCLVNSSSLVQGYFWWEGLQCSYSTTNHISNFCIDIPVWTINTVSQKLYFCTTNLQLPQSDNSTRTVVAVRQLQYLLTWIYFMSS